jgi:hypothetical protein
VIEITLYYNSPLFLPYFPLFSPSTLSLPLSRPSSETLRQRCLLYLPAAYSIPVWNLPSPVTNSAETSRVVAIFMPADQRFMVASSVVPGFGLLNVGNPPPGVLVAIPAGREA